MTLSFSNQNDIIAIKHTYSRLSTFQKRRFPKVLQQALNDNYHLVADALIIVQSVSDKQLPKKFLEALAATKLSKTVELVRVTMTRQDFERIAALNITDKLHELLQLLNTNGLLTPKNFPKYASLDESNVTSLLQTLNQLDAANLLTLENFKLLHKHPYVQNLSIVQLLISHNMLKKKYFAAAMQSHAPHECIAALCRVRAAGLLSDPASFRILFGTSELCNTWSRIPDNQFTPKNVRRIRDIAVNFSGRPHKGQTVLLDYLKLHLLDKKNSYQPKATLPCTFFQTVPVTVATHCLPNVQLTYLH